MIDHNARITIVGLGLLGGSYAKGFHAAGYRNLVGIDINEEAITEALAQGLIREGGSDPALVRDSDIVISALYPHAFPAWVKENQKYFKPGCFLSDVTGVKREVIRQVREVLRDDVLFTACHPMAGREYKGLAYADEKRFHAANYIVVPDEKAPAEGVQIAKEIGEILQFKHIAVLSPEEHDAMIAFLSQLTHVIAVALMNTKDNTHLAEYTGDSFRDLTRIAVINEDLWPELFIMNKDYLIREIDAFVEEMLAFRKLVEEEDAEGMKQKMIISTERRKKFTKQ